MAHYQTKIRSPRPADEVFDYMADLRNFDEWDPGTVTATQVTGEGAGIGSAYDLEVKVPLRNVTMRYTVTEYDPTAPVRRVVAHGAGGLFSAVDTITVEPDPSGPGSVLVYDAVVRLSGPLGLLDPLFNKAFQRTGDHATEGLLRVLEADRV